MEHEERQRTSPSYFEKLTKLPNRVLKYVIFSACDRDSQALQRVILKTALFHFRVKIAFLKFRP